MLIKRPIIILKQALSCNGYLDDKSQYAFSNTEDSCAVQKIRSSVDAILVGANTVRNDDPSLLVKLEPLILKRVSKGLSAQPIRVVVSGEKSLSSKSKVFSDELAKTILFHSKNKAISIDGILGAQNEFLIQKEYLGSNLDVVLLLEILFEMGIRSVLLEGGANLATRFLKQDLVDVMRFAYSQVLIKKKGATRYALMEEFQIKNIKPKVEILGGMYALWYELTEQGAVWRQSL